MHRLTTIEDRLFPRHRQITVTRVALALLAFVGILAGPGVAGYALWQIFGPAPIGDGNSLIGGHPGPVAWTCAAIAGVIGTIAAIFAWRAVRELGEKGEEVVDGAHSGISSLMLMLGGVNVLGSYFGQFWVFIDACAQVSVVAMLVRVRSRARVADKGH